MNQNPEVFYRLCDSQVHKDPQNLSCFNRKYCSLMDFSKTFGFLAFARSKSNDVRFIVKSAFCFADIQWVNAKLNLGDQKYKKGKYVEIDCSNEGNKRENDEINFVKFSPNERLIAVCNEESIKIFEVKSLIQNQIIVFQEFETTNKSNTITYLEFSNFNDTEFKPSRNTILLYIDNKGGLWLGIVISAVQKCIIKEVIVATFSFLYTNPELYYIDCHNIFTRVQFDNSDNKVISWQIKSKVPFKQYLKDQEHIKFLKQLTENVFLIAGLNMQQGFKWVKLIRFYEQTQQQRMICEYTILHNSRMPENQQEMNAFAFTMTTSRDGMIYYITDNFSQKVELLYATSQEKQEFNIAIASREQKYQFSIPCSQILRRNEATIKGLCYIELKIDDEQQLNNEKIFTSLFVLTNMYSIGRVIVSNTILKHNPNQNKLQFTEGDDLYDGADENMIQNDDIENVEVQRKNFQQTTDANRKIFNIKNSLKQKGNEDGMNQENQQQIRQNQQNNIFSGHSQNQNYMSIQENTNYQNQMQQDNNGMQQEFKSQQQEPLNIFQKNHLNGLPGMANNMQQNQVQNQNFNQNTQQVTNNILPYPKNPQNMNIFQQNEQKQNNQQQMQNQQPSQVSQQQKEIIQNPQRVQQPVSIQIKLNQNPSQDRQNQQSNNINIFQNQNQQQNPSNNGQQKNIFAQDKKNNEIAPFNQQSANQTNQQQADDKKTDPANVVSLFAAPPQRSQPSTISALFGSQKQNQQNKNQQQNSQIFGQVPTPFNTQAPSNNRNQSDQLQYYEENKNEDQNEIKQVQRNLLAQKSNNLINKNQLPTISEEIQRNNNLNPLQGLDKTKNNIFAGGNSNNKNIFTQQNNSNTQIQSNPGSQSQLPDLALQKQMTFGINDQQEQVTGLQNRIQNNQVINIKDQYSKIQNASNNNKNIFANQQALQNQENQNIQQSNQGQQVTNQNNQILQNQNPNVQDNQQQQNRQGQNSIFNTQAKISLLSNEQNSQLVQQNQQVQIKNQKNEEKQYIPEELFDKETLHKYRIVNWLSNKLQVLNNMDSRLITPETQKAELSNFQYFMQQFIIQLYNNIVINEVKRDYSMIELWTKELFEQKIDSNVQTILETLSVLDAPSQFFINLFEYPHSTLDIVRQQKGLYNLELSQIKFFKNNFKFKQNIIENKIRILMSFLSTLNNLVDESIDGIINSRFNFKNDSNENKTQLKILSILPYKNRKILLMDYFKRRFQNKIEEMKLIDKDVKKINFDQINQIKPEDLQQQLDLICFSAIKKEKNIEDNENLFSTINKKKNPSPFNMSPGFSPTLNYNEFFGQIKTNIQNIQKRNQVFDNFMKTQKKDSSEEQTQQENHVKQESQQTQNKVKLDFRNINFEDISSEDEEDNYYNQTKNKNEQDKNKLQNHKNLIERSDFNQKQNIFQTQQVKLNIRDNIFDDNQSTQVKNNQKSGIQQNINVREFNDTQFTQLKQDEKQLIEKKELLKITGIGIHRIKDKSSKQMFNYLKTKGRRGVIENQYKPVYNIDDIIQEDYDSYTYEVNNKDEINSQDSNYLIEQLDELEINQVYYYNEQKSDFSSIVLDLNENPRIKMQRYLEFKQSRSRQADEEFYKKYGSQIQNSQQTSSIYVNNSFQNKGVISLQKNQTTTILGLNNILQNVAQTNTNQQPQNIFQNQQQQQENQASTQQQKPVISLQSQQKLQLQQNSQNQPNQINNLNKQGNSTNIFENKNNQNQSTQQQNNNNIFSKDSNNNVNKNNIFNQNNDTNQNKQNILSNNQQQNQQGNNNIFQNQQQKQDNNIINNPNQNNRNIFQNNQNQQNNNTMQDQQQNQNQQNKFQNQNTGIQPQQNINIFNQNNQNQNKQNQNIFQNNQMQNQQNQQNNSNNIFQNNPQNQMQNGMDRQNQNNGMSQQGQNLSPIFQQTGNNQQQQQQKNIYENQKQNTNQVGNSPNFQQNQNQQSNNNQNIFPQKQQQQQNQNNIFQNSNNIPLNQNKNIFQNQNNPQQNQTNIQINSNKNNIFDQQQNTNLNNKQGSLVSQGNIFAPRMVGGVQQQQQNEQQQQQQQQQDNKMDDQQNNHQNSSNSKDAKPSNANDEYYKQHKLQHDMKNQNYKQTQSDQQKNNLPKAQTQISSFDLQIQQFSITQRPKLQVKERGQLLQNIQNNQTMQ